MNDKETAADAALRLCHMIETIPKVEFNDEAITGFAVSILSNCDHNLRRELNSHSITSKTQLCRILRGVSMKRLSDDVVSYTSKINAHDLITTDQRLLLMGLATVAARNFTHFSIVL